MALENLTDLTALNHSKRIQVGIRKLKYCILQWNQLPAGRVAGEVEHLPNDSGNLRRKHIWILFITHARWYKDKL
jgi:hypothetical protein